MKTNSKSPSMSTSGDVYAVDVCFQVELLHPQPGWVEMDPDALWDCVQTVIKHALEGKLNVLYLICFCRKTQI